MTDGTDRTQMILTWGCEKFAWVKSSVKLHSLRPPPDRQPVRERERAGNSSKQITGSLESAHASIQLEPNVENSTQKIHFLFYFMFQLINKLQFSTGVKGELFKRIECSVTRMRDFSLVC